MLNKYTLKFTCEIASSTVALEMDFFKEEIFFISLIYIICFFLFQNCLGDSHVAAFITLKYMIYCKVQQELPMGLWFIFVRMCHCCTTFQNCPRYGHVPAFITLKCRIYCKVLIRGVS